MNTHNSGSEEIADRINSILKEMAEIKDQIGRAKSLAAQTGEYSDSDWFQRATFALRMKSREHQALQVELGRRRRQEKDVHNSRIERAFIEMVRDYIEPSLFSKLMRDAVMRSEQ